MFGPEGTFERAALAASHEADAPAPRQELLDISSAWPMEAIALLGKIIVPGHYRQADRDALWIVSSEEVRAFGAACSAAPTVDCALVENAGHCIDLHRAGPALHLQQLAFALHTGLEHRLSEESRSGDAPS